MPIFLINCVSVYIYATPARHYKIYCRCLVRKAFSKFKICHFCICFYAINTNITFFREKTIKEQV